MNEQRFDPVLFSEFIDESIESLSQIEPLFVTILKNPDSQIINTIFRPIHSLKGNSAFFGLFNIKKVAHSIENILDKLRNNKITPNEKLLSTLNDGVDLLKKLLANSRTSQKDLVDTDEMNHLLSTIDDIIKNKDLNSSAILVNDILPSLESLQDTLPDQYKEIVTNLILKITRYKLPDSPADTNLLQSGNLPEPLLQLKQFIESKDSEILNEYNTVNILPLLRQLPGYTIDKTTIEIINKIIDEYFNFTEKIGFDNFLREYLVDHLQILLQKGNWKQTLIENKVENESRDSLISNASTKTMRVAESTIDTFLAYVGELVVVEEMLAFLHKKITVQHSNNTLSIEFGRTLQTFKELSSNLQKSIMAVRQVPVSNLLQKIPRIAHDIAELTGKKVNVEMNNSNLFVDKSYIDILDAPIMHIIRNAVDHGIELPEERLAQQKDSAGLITINTHTDSTDFIIEISDNGKGIDFEKVYQKVISMGLAKSNTLISNELLTEFLFTSGMSTSESVTEISGRGVGLEVAKLAIKNAGGKIIVNSKKKHGTTFTITLPLSVSTQIIEGFLVRSDELTIVFPLEHIKESFSARGNQISTVTGIAEVVIRHGQTIPVHNLSKLLNPAYVVKRDSNKDCIFVVIQNNEKIIALEIDELEGVQTVVLKTIDGLEINSSIFDGGAIKGDGKVALIIGKSGLDYLFTHTL
jgi:two-component system chemotaxis sensor kinase CheA